MNYILTKARVYAIESGAFSPQDSVAVADGKIVRIGSLSDCRASISAPVEIIDLKGRILLPAFTDSHTHFVELAKQRLQLNLTGCVSIAQVRDRITTFRNTHRQSPAWILGGGWDKNRIDSPRELHKELLDCYFPSTPVALYSKDYHSRWCNSKALELTGWNDHSPDPPGGKLVKDHMGRLTGIIYETASELLERLIAPPSEQQVGAAIRDTIAEVHKLGLTAVHTMESSASARLLSEAITQDRTLRLCWHFPLEDLDAMIAAGRRSYSGDEWIKLGGVKIFADGSLGSQTAAMDHAYPDDPSNKGTLRYTQDHLFAIASRAAEHGISCSIHAIGQRAVRTVISAFLRVKDAHPRQELMQRIEHVQSIAPEDFPSLKLCRAHCALQPVHLANDIDMIERHWQPVKANAYPFKSFVNRHIPFSFGSDAPIETINPFHGIYSALARKKELDPNNPAWFPAQRLGLNHALWGYTMGAAMASCSESYRGSISEGKAADLIALDDFASAPKEFWLEAKSRLTMLDGEIQWSDL